MSDSTARRVLMAVCVVAMAAAPSVVEAHNEPIQYGVGLKVGGGPNFLGPPAIDAELNPPIPMFLGSAGGIGLAMEALYGGYVGLELDLVDVSASAKGRFTFASRDGTLTVDQELASRELQVPLLVVGQLPWFEHIKPRLTLGPTFVIQRSTKYTVDADVETLIVDPDPASYVMWTAGLGVAMVFDHIQIPIDVRVAYHALDDRPETRGRYLYSQEDAGLFLDEITVNAAWQGQLWFLVGMQYSGEVPPWW